MGGSELEGGIVKIKNLETREECEVAIDKIGEYLTSLK